jgi:hypothetical protein
VRNGHVAPESAVTFTGIRTNGLTADRPVFLDGLFRAGHRRPRRNVSMVRDRNGENLAIALWERVRAIFGAEIPPEIPPDVGCYPAFPLWLAVLSRTQVIGFTDDPYVGESA